MKPKSRLKTSISITETGLILQLSSENLWIKVIVGQKVPKPLIQARISGTFDNGDNGIWTRGLVANAALSSRAMSPWVGIIAQREKLQEHPEWKSTKLSRAMTIIIGGDENGQGLRRKGCQKEIKWNVQQHNRKTETENRTRPINSAGNGT